jgi:hypothetical protein
MRSTRCFNNLCFLIALIKKTCISRIFKKHVTFIYKLYDISYKPICKKNLSIAIYNARSRATTYAIMFLTQEFLNIDIRRNFQK